MLLNLGLDPVMLTHIQKQLGDTQLLRFRWSNRYVSSFRWDTQAADAIKFANEYTGSDNSTEFTFIQSRFVSFDLRERHDTGVDDLGDDDDDDDEDFISASHQANGHSLADVLDVTDDHSADEVILSQDVKAVVGDSDDDSDIFPDFPGVLEDTADGIPVLSPDQTRCPDDDLITFLCFSRS